MKWDGIAFIGLSGLESAVNVIIPIKQMKINFLERAEGGESSVSVVTNLSKRERMV
jgi:hypothetical protein